MISKHVKTTFLKAVVFVLAITQATSCATFYISGKQKINLSAPSSKSTVYVDNEEVGQGTSVTTKVKKVGAKQVVVQTPGYKDSYHVLLPKKKVGAYAPLLVLDIPFFVFLYPIFFDLAPQSKFFAYPKENDLKAPAKYNNKTETEKYINLEAIKATIENKDKDLKDFYGVNYSDDIFAEIDKAERQGVKYDEKLEAKNSKKKKKKLLDEGDKKLSFDDTKFSDVLYKTLKKTGYIDTTKKILLDNNDVLTLEGNIKKASLFHITGKGGSQYQKAKIYITWNMKNVFGEVVDSVSGWHYSADFVNDSKEKFTKMIGDAVENSYMNLFKKKEFTAQLAVNNNYKINDGALAIKKATNVVKEVSDASAATVTVKRADGGHGSGFAITNDGYIITNFHVIAGKNTGATEKVTVILSNGTEIPATVVRYNRLRDVALLKVDKTFDKAFVLSNEKGYKNLAEVYTIGTPKSLELGQTVSLGLISNERKTANAELLQLSMSINGGNSGGPLFEKNGTLHGVVSAKLVGYATEGVGFAIPSYLISSYLNLNLN